MGLETSKINLNYIEYSSAFIYSQVRIVHFTHIFYDYSLHKWMTKFWMAIAWSIFFSLCPAFYVSRIGRLTMMNLKKDFNFDTFSP